MAWDSRKQQQGTYGVYAQRFGPDLTPKGLETQVNLTTVSAQQAPSVVCMLDNVAVAAWESLHQDGDRSGCFLRRLDQDQETCVHPRGAGQQYESCRASGQWYRGMRFPLLSLVLFHLR